MIVSNWTTVFRNVNGSFNAVADFIGSSSGAGDMFQGWMGQLQQQFATNPALTLWDIITGDPAGTITVLLLLVAYVVYALAIIVFCFFYVLFGSVLYVLGPLVLALIPIAGIGQLGRAYAINLMIWNAWAILYAVFGALITAIQFNRVEDVLGNGFLGYLKGLPDSTLLGLVSIFYALAVALIPFIAKRIISGDAGSTVYSLVRAGVFAVGTAVAAAAGITAGAAAPAATATGGAAAAAASSGPVPATGMGDFIRGGVTSAMSSNSSPPTPPPSSSSAPRRPTGSVYRPHGPVQVLSYMAGRRLAMAIAGDPSGGRRRLL
jgi:hypothetical protein